MTFLGFSILRSQTRNGTKTKVVFKTESKRFTRAKLRLKERLHRIMHLPLEIQAASINTFPGGHCDYYGVAGNLDALQRLWHYSRLYWRRNLSQQSQSWQVSREQMVENLNRYPLRAPRLKTP